MRSIVASIDRDSVICDIRDGGRAVAGAAVVQLDSHCLGAVIHDGVCDINVLDSICIGFSKRSDREAMTGARAGDSIHCHIVAARLESNAIIIVGDFDVCDSGVGARTNIKSVGVLRQIGGLGCSIHGQACVVHVGCISFLIDEDVWGVLDPEPRGDEIGATNNIKYGCSCQ